MSQNLLIIVESPAKAKSISQYLTSFPQKCTVIASYGHIRSLPRKNGSVIPEQGFKMQWAINPASAKHVDNIIKSVELIAKSNGTVVLATDADREGEAIAWHIKEIIKEAKINCNIKRIIFHEITKKSIINSLTHLSDINQSKVDAYFSRLGLDYLFGFGLSPVLWTKVRGCKSAGRVQSPALRAIVDREFEIINFVSEKYWDLSATVQIKDKVYEAALTEWQGKAVTKFMWTEKSVIDATKVLQGNSYKITSIEKKKQTQSPHAPFITSTLQQAASSELNWKPSQTMQVAQKLYEGININGDITGLITYMRTDSLRMDKDIVKQYATFIEAKHGKKYSTIREFTNKKATTQDAHEAIRPTSLSYEPDAIKGILNEEQYKLYALIWKRTLASQMSDAEYRVLNIIVSGEDGKWKVHLRDKVFDGFTKVIPDKDDFDSIPDLSSSASVTLFDIKANVHNTVPPARFTEASLIKHLDEVGIGRPSTYVSVIETLQKRGYIEKNAKKLVPLVHGWIVTGFLKLFCQEYIQDDFTASLESDLDAISQGECDWSKVLNNFWVKFKPLIDSLQALKPNEVSQKVCDLYEKYFFEGNDRKCTECSNGYKVFCLTSTGSFIGCSNYPSCNQASKGKADSIGIDPSTQEHILVKKGPYGHYLHWENAKVNVSLPAKLLPDINLELALKLKSLPKTLGKHPYTGKDVKLHIGSYGPYISHDEIYSAYKFEDNFMDITLEKALDTLGAAKPKSRPSQSRNKKAKTS